MKKLIGLHFLGDSPEPFWSKMTINKELAKQWAKTFEKELEELMYHGLMVPSDILGDPNPSNVPADPPAFNYEALEKAMKELMREEADRVLMNDLKHEVMMSNCARYLRIWREGKMGKQFLRYLIGQQLGRKLSRLEFRGQVESVDLWITDRQYPTLIETVGTSLEEYALFVVESGAFMVKKGRMFDFTFYAMSNTRWTTYDRIERGAEHHTRTYISP
jgi:hypothetical protein